MTTPSPIDAERVLMQGIKAKYGRFIAAAIAGSPFPESLLAALVANETGLDPYKKRLEPAVLADLAQVFVGHKPAYGSIGGQDIGNALSTTTFVGVLRLIDWATSWGPTQIMGYQALAGKYDVAELTNLETHFKRAVEELRAFVKEWHESTDPVKPPIQLDRDLLTCWNTGRLHGKTFDPAYVDNGLRRMTLYESLEEGKAV